MNTSAVMMEEEAGGKPLHVKLNWWLREQLWSRFMNQHLIVSLNVKEPQTIHKLPFLKIVGYCLFSQSQNIFYFTLILNFIVNGDLLSLVLPLSLLLYGLLDRPHPSVKYFKYMQLYLLCVIIAKFLYQLPIFCASPAFTIYEPEICKSQRVPLDVLVQREDYLIGLRKYWGVAQAEEAGILWGLLPDIICLVALLVMKRYLVVIGVWDYVRVQQSIYQTPSFKRDIEDLTEAEALSKQTRKVAKQKSWREANFLGKFKIASLRQYTKVKSFFQRLLPMYMANRQDNLDMRTQ